MGLRLYYAIELAREQWLEFKDNFLRGARKIKMTLPVISIGDRREKPVIFSCFRTKPKSNKRLGYRQIESALVVGYCVFDEDPNDQIGTSTITGITGKDMLKLYQQLPDWFNQRAELMITTTERLGVEK